MSNLFTLIKIEFSKSFSRNSIKENKAKSYSFLSILLLVVILGIVLSTTYAFIYGNVYKEAGLEVSPVLILFAMAASMLSLFSGINQSKGIFIGKDYDLLSSLPIRKRDIIASKVINLYLVELLYSVIIIIPASVVLFLISNDYNLLIVGILLAIFVSAFPLVISILFAFLTSLLSDKFKYGNILNIIFYVILFAGLFSMSFLISSSKDVNQQADNLSLIANVVRWINPAVYFVDLSFSENILYILVFVGINFISIVLTILFISLFFDKIHELITSVKADYKYVRKDLKNKKEFKTLFDIEFKRFITSKMYFINSVSGIISSVVLSVFLCVTFMKANPTGQGKEIFDTIKDNLYLASIIIMFGVGISNTATVGISIEGNNFWLVKSLPINYKKYMHVKLLLAIIINTIGSLICSTIITIMLKPDILSIIGLYLIPIIYSLLTIILSLMLNLTFHKLKWQSEREVVKSSSAVIISMLIGMLVDFVIAGVLITLGIFTSKLIAILITSSILLVATIIVYIILNNIFEKKLMSIEDF